MSYQAHNVTHVKQGAVVLRITAFPRYITIQRGTGYCGRFVLTDERMEFYWFEKHPTFAHLYDGLCWDYDVLKQLITTQQPTT